MPINLNLNAQEKNTLFYSCIISASSLPFLHLLIPLITRNPLLTPKRIQEEAGALTRLPNA